MDPRRQEEQVQEQLRFLNVVCGALVASVAVYPFLAWFLVEGPGGLQPLGEPPTVVVVLGAVAALALLVLAPVAHSRMLERGDHPGPDGEITPALESYRIATILAFVLREGAAILGLVLTLLTGNILYCYGLAAASVVAMFAGWPRREQLGTALRPPPTQA